MASKFIQCETRKEAEAAYPASAKIVKVDGGYMCFETGSDYKVWKNQK